MIFFFGGNWMCARVSKWRFPGTNLIWDQARRYGVLFGWKFQTDPGLVIWTGPRSEISNWCELGAPHGGFLGKIWVGPELSNIDFSLVVQFQTNPKWNQQVAPKDATPVFLPFPVFWEPQLDPLLNFQGSDSLPSEGYQNPSHDWDHPLLRLRKIYNMVRKFWSLKIQPKSHFQVNGRVQTYSRTYCPNNCRHIHMWYV